MSQEIDLEELERKAFRSMFQDGLWDIFLGLYTLALSTSPLAYLRGIERPLSYIPAFAITVIGVLAMRVAKKSITLPRMGLVKLGRRRKARFKKMRIVLSIASLLTTILIVLTLTGDVKPADWGAPGWLMPGVIGMLTAVEISFMAYFVGYAPLYLYGWLFGLSFPVSALLEEYAGITFPVAFVASGVVMLLIGTVSLIRFLRDYPLPAEGALDGNS